MKIGFIGLGIMGESMCENIAKKHNDTVYVYDHKQAQIDKLVSFGAIGCKDEVEIAEKADVIIFVAFILLSIVSILVSHKESWLMICSGWA